MVIFSNGFLHNSLCLRSFDTVDKGATSWKKCTLQPHTDKKSSCTPLVSLCILLQMLIEITEACSVITWDFDVSKGDVIFNIFHSKRAPQPPKRDTLGTHALTSLGAVSAQLIDKNWVLGKDYSMVERALTCKEGESVQVWDEMLD